MQEEKNEKNSEIKEERKNSEKNNETFIAVIRIRGITGVRKGTADTLDMLCLYKKNYCAVLRNTPSILGMLKKVKDYVTYGEISMEVLEELLKKRAEINPMDKEKKRTKKFFRLNSPRGGYGRRGIKKPFTKKGSLGYRGGNINDLLKRMI